METQTKTSAKDLFINLGAIIALGIIVGHLIDLLFTIINKAYPITTGYGYYGSYSISWSVAALIVSLPIYILLMWLLEREYIKEPEKRNVGIRKWLTYITLFLAGFATAGDLITVLYYFIDGQEMTTGFIMKALTILVIALAVFFYYISDVMGKLNSISRRIWMVVSLVIILVSIILGFSILGFPHTQKLIRYDEQKINDLQNINSQIQSYFSNKKVLPKNISEITNSNYGYSSVVLDKQTNKSYEYIKTNDVEYQLCAEFNKASDDKNVEYSYLPNYGSISSHSAGRYCFNQNVNNLK